MTAYTQSTRVSRRGEVPSGGGILSARFNRNLLQPSDIESPPQSPRAEKKSLRVEFSLMEDDDRKDSDSSDVEMDVAKFRRNGVNNQRFLQPRMSLLGKPLNYRQHRRDIRYRRLQAKIYNFLERPKFWSAWMYHIAV
ncbi:hypothetical protein SNE40_006306 [Patella caerulea]|uniref:Uncharacterized protein n=1 Tax=Patella caerulea TaxID=87958 RepID=A0AAN8K7M4_PATCE